MPEPDPAARISAIPADDGATPDLVHGLHVAVTGSGSALVDPERGGASAAVIVDGVVLQFDCGRGVMENLARVGIDPVTVDRLFLTHLHFDHIASFGYFVISSWIAGRQNPLRVYGPPETEAMARGSIHGAHAVDVRYIESMIASAPPDMPSPLRPTPPVEVHEIEAGTVLEEDDYAVTAVATYHYREHGIESLAYRVDCRYGSVVVTGDGRPCQELVDLSEDADILVAECAKPDGGMLPSGQLTGSDPDAEPSGGHTTPTWLGRMAAQARVGTVVATHLGPFTSAPAAIRMSRRYYGDQPPPPGFWDEFRERINRHYDGPVVLAHDGQVVTVGAASRPARPAPSAGRIAPARPSAY